MSSRRGRAPFVFVSPGSKPGQPTEVGEDLRAPDRIGSELRIQSGRRRAGQDLVAGLIAGDDFEVGDRLPVDLTHGR